MSGQARACSGVRPTSRIFSSRFNDRDRSFPSFSTFPSFNTSARKVHLMHRPAGIGAFQFVVLSSLRAVQLQRGCVPRVEGVHKITVTAQLEVSQGMVAEQLPLTPRVPSILIG